jgi:hypothetical protein
MSTDYKALCAELVALDGHYVVDCTEEWADAMCRIRAELAKPEPVEPTDEELISPIMWMIDDCIYENDKGEIAQSLRELIARWGAPAIQPVSVNERLPGVGDCDAERFCWFWDYGWTRQQRGWHDDECTHWLPHWALPIPANNTREEN